MPFRRWCRIGHGFALNIIDLIKGRARAGAMVIRDQIVRNAEQPCPGVEYRCIALDAHQTDKGFMRQFGRNLGR